MSRRDPIVAVIRSSWSMSPEQATDRILALIFPETPDPKMVEKVAFAIDPDAQELSPAARRMMFQAERVERACNHARAALAAGRKWWSE